MPNQNNSKEPDAEWFAEKFLRLQMHIKKFKLSYTAISIIIPIITSMCIVFYCNSRDLPSLKVISDLGPEIVIFSIYVFGIIVVFILMSMAAAMFSVLAVKHEPTLERKKPFKLWLILYGCGVAMVLWTYSYLINLEEYFPQWVAHTFIVSGVLLIAAAASFYYMHKWSNGKPSGDCRFAIIMSNLMIYFILTLFIAPLAILILKEPVGELRNTDFWQRYLTSGMYEYVILLLFVIFLLLFMTFRVITTKRLLTIGFVLIFFLTFFIDKPNFMDNVFVSLGLADRNVVLMLKREHACNVRGFAPDAQCSPERMKNPNELIRTNTLELKYNGKDTVYLASREHAGKPVPVARKDLLIVERLDPELRNAG